MQNINKTRGDIFILTTILIFRQKNPPFLEIWG